MSLLSITMDNRIESCRVCLVSKQDKLRSLFKKYKEFFLYEYINTLTNVEIKLNDGFPDLICKSCYVQLKSAIKFKEKCITSDIKLRANTVKEEVLESTTNLLIKSEKSEDDSSKSDDENHHDLFDYSTEQEFVPNNKDSKICVAYPMDLCMAEIANKDSKTKNVFKNRTIDPKVECHDCGDFFRSKCKLKVHWKKTHMLSSLICTDCKRAFKSYKAFHLHKKKKSKSCSVASDKNVFIEGVGADRIFCCKECDYRSKRVKDMSSHLVIHTGERPFQCNLCSKSYTQLSSLQGHQETAHQKYTVEVTCHFCGKYVKGRRKVNRHLRSHKKITCTVCNKSLGKLNFFNHMKRHSGVKSYACELCASTFYTISELCNHKRMVHNKKHFKCDLCDYKSSKQNCIKIHMSKHTGKNLPCTICGRFYLTTEKLALHQKAHYCEKKFSCPHCTLTFLKRDSLRRHLNLKHASINDPDVEAVTIEVKVENVCPPQLEAIPVDE